MTKRSKIAETVAIESWQKIPIKQAFATSRSNKFSRWPTRTPENRLEPECWPGLSPSFQFEKSAQFFTIGSCFARNIERHLHQEGFNVAAYGALGEWDVGGQRLINRYTPAAIYQELHWAWKIYQRDGKVTADDIMPFLIEQPNGKWFDMLCRLSNSEGFTLNEMLELRQGLYDIFKYAFTSEIAIVTLGLIECWLDEKSGLFVQFDPRFLARKDRDRFSFVQLDFNESHQFVSKTIKLLENSGCKHILLTTSPVPNPRTFTGDDAIIANTYSKAVLRAVTGQVAKESAMVDYFPSFESVVLTKRPEIWENDLSHVQADFISRIMLRVTREYVRGEEHTSVSAPLDDGLAMAELVRAQKLDQAMIAYKKLGTGIFDLENNYVHLAAAELLGTTDETALALKHAALVDTNDEQFCNVDPIALYTLSQIYQSVGQLEKAADLFAKFIEITRKLPRVMMNCLGLLVRKSSQKEFVYLLETADREKIGSGELIDKLSYWYCTLDRVDDARRICERGLENEPENLLLHARLVRVAYLSNDLETAISASKNLIRLAPDGEDARLKLVRYLRKAEKLEEAICVAMELLSKFPENAMGHALLARLLWKTGKKQQARQEGSLALQLGEKDVAVIREVGTITVQR
jgi:tetratricopeptide (TPR) repeat protein